MPILYEIGVSEDLWSLMDDLNHFDADLNHTLAYLLVLILVGTDWLSCTHKFLKLQTVANAKVCTCAHKKQCVLILALIIIIIEASFVLNDIVLTIQVCLRSENVSRIYLCSAGQINHHPGESLRSKRQKYIRDLPLQDGNTSRTNS